MQFFIFPKQRLLIGGRVLVGEGILTKSCRKKPKKRQFYLFNDILVYGNIVINKKKYNKQHIIPLEGVTIEDLIDIDSTKGYGWLIKTPNKSFAVYAATETEKQEWILHINRCIDDLLRRTGKVASSAHAAVWIPDDDAPLCMHCRKTQFTVLNRRHHCRNCGSVICGNCSKNKFIIPISTKPVRVCDTCFNDLCQRRVSTPGGTQTTVAPLASSTVTNESSNVSQVTSTGAQEEPELVANTSNNNNNNSNINTNTTTTTASSSQNNNNNNNNARYSHESSGKAESVSNSSQEDASTLDGKRNSIENTANIVTTRVPLSDKVSDLSKQDISETDDDSDDEENGNPNETCASLEMSTTPVFYDEIDPLARMSHVTIDDHSNSVAAEVSKEKRPASSASVSSSS